MGHGSRRFISLDIPRFGISLKKLLDVSPIAA